MSDNQGPPTTQLAAGELSSLKGPRQIYTPKPILLGTNSGAGGGGSATTTLIMPIPDSQTRSKLSVFFVPAGTEFASIINNGTIWVAACEEDQKGAAGGGGGYYPVNDLEGTAGAPFAFPASDGLSGYSREFVTIADAIQAVIVVNSIGGGVKGVWVAQFRIQPFAVLFPWDAWAEIRRDYQPRNNGSKFSL